MTEQASIKFLEWLPLYNSEKPFQIFMDISGDVKDQRKTNLVWDERAVTVTDFRNNNEFELDTHGFTVRELPGFSELDDAEIIRKEFLPAVERMLKTELDDVGTVFIFDWRLRSSAPQPTPDKVNFSDLSQFLLPSNYAHSDTGPISVIQRIQRSFPKDADRILSQRIRAVNVWKPLSNPVNEWPLAVCDGSTVAADDMVETDSIRQGSVSTNYYVKYNATQKWYFLQKQTPEEALIFKHFDTKRGVTPYALHSSVKLRDVPDNAKPRKSVEIRTLIFSERFGQSEADPAPV